MNADGSVKDKHLRENVKWQIFEPTRLNSYVPPNVIGDTGRKQKDRDGGRSKDEENILPLG